MRSDDQAKRRAHTIGARSEGCPHEGAQEEAEEHQPCGHSAGGWRFVARSEMTRLTGQSNQCQFACITSRMGAIGDTRARTVGVPTDNPRSASSKWRSISFHRFTSLR